MLKRDEIVEILLKHGIRVNENRIKILEHIFFNECTTSAIELIEILSREKGTDKATIYRNLDLFESKKLIMKEVDQHGISRYCASKLNKTHLHFFCKVCNQTICKEVDNISALGLEGYKIGEVEIKITGVCKDCNYEG